MIYYQLISKYEPFPGIMMIILPEELHKCTYWFFLSLLYIYSLLYYINWLS